MKLEFHDLKQHCWVDAKAKAVIPQLRNGTLDESGTVLETFLDREPYSGFQKF